MQNLSTTCWLLSETLAATWTSGCTTYFHIWAGFLRTWVQWVTSWGRDSIRAWKRWKPGIRVAGTQSWWLTTVGLWRHVAECVTEDMCDWLKTCVTEMLPDAEHFRNSKDRSSSPEVWTMVKQHAIYVCLPLSIPTIQFTAIKCHRFCHKIFFKPMFFFQCWPLEPNGPCKKTMRIA